MLKLLAKKGKSNKGFTLIELIVVIAIIAILALLLVPRFAGFTEDARVANDRNACETIERAFQTLIANDTFRIPAACTITISTGGTWAYSAGQLNNRSNALFTVDGAAPSVEASVENLTGNIEVQAKTIHTVGFRIEIQTNGTVTCTVS
ncbi:MAG: prepilin-type N-terminal cleavage/methylation domain-containing protein [Clostridiaceae bacterium]|nr:prepilin-type N-terminal cleavage/methylation domain-containing protein [Clostridiaceae bacterium]